MSPSTAKKDEEFVFDTEDIPTMVHAIQARARVDPVWFSQSILGLKTQRGDKDLGYSWKMDKWQVETQEAVADIWRKINKIKTKFNHEGKNKITIRAGHGPGKTFVIASIMHWFNFCFNGTIIATAPKEKQILTRLWPTFRKIKNRSTKFYRENVDIGATKITWFGDEDRVAHAETANDPDNLAGYHDQYLMFIIDEASGVKEVFFPAIEGALSAGKFVLMILIGNPTKNVGTFYDSHNRRGVRENYYRMHVTPRKSSRMNKSWIKEMVDKYGKDSATVKVRCYGEFADLDQHQLMPLAWIQQANDREFKPDGSIPKLRLSIDVADGGEDESVITVAKIYQTFMYIMHQKTYSYPAAESPILCAQEAMRTFKEYGGCVSRGDDIVVDSIGVGAGTAGYLIQQRQNVVIYRGGSTQHVNTKLYRNRRVQSYLSMRNDYRDGKVVCAENFTDAPDDFEAQMVSIHTRPGIERVEDLELKESHKARTGFSPDRPDSAAMLWATQPPRLAPVDPDVLYAVDSQIEAYDCELV